MAQMTLAINTDSTVFVSNTYYVRHLFLISFLGIVVLPETADHDRFSNDGRTDIVACEITPLSFMDSTFTIRRCIDVDEACHYFLTWPIKEGWNHSTDDEEVRQVFYPGDPDGFILGTIQDKGGQETVVGCILAIRHTNELAWIGCYIVGEEHRGKGYGTKIFNAAMDHLKKCRYIGLDAKVEKVAAYKRAGFKQTGGWTGKTFRGDMVKDVLEKLQAEDYQDVNVEDWTRTDSTQDIAHLEKQSTGYDRPDFWNRWVNMHTGVTKTGESAKDHGRHVVKVLDQDGKIAHFASIRPAVKGFLITLYAGNLHVAKALLRYLVQWVVDRSASDTWLLPKSHWMVINGNGCASNPDSLNLYEQLDFEWVSTRERMYYDAYPTGSISQLYSVASLTVG
ncbi:acyl-CoA N-acyltransferase [Chlamydoabsidia padenii]|nr:acyl-CoA N-acyltransferase [Chlamydoabsidia padenii]